LREENYGNLLLDLPPGKISLGDMKTAVNTLRGAESRLLGRKFKVNYFEQSQDWLVDPVINGFLLRTCSKEDTIFLLAAESEVVFKGLETYALFSKDCDGTIADVFDWSAVQQVLIPFNKDKNHWVLLLVLPQKTEIQGNYNQIPIVQA